MKNTFRHPVSRVATVMALWLGAVAAQSVWAQAVTDHNHHAAAPSAAPAADQAEGEVRRIDLDGGKITLKHGDIKNLDMPPMTMVFHVDKALLGALKVGDKVRFKAVHEAGKYTVTDIQPRP